MMRAGRVDVQCRARAAAASSSLAAAQPRAHRGRARVCGARTVRPAFDSAPRPLSVSVHVTCRGAARRARRRQAVSLLVVLVCILVRVAAFASAALLLFLDVVAEVVRGLHVRRRHRVAGDEPRVGSAFRAGGGCTATGSASASAPSGRPTMSTCEGRPSGRHIERRARSPPSDTAATCAPRSTGFSGAMKSIIARLARSTPSTSKSRVLCERRPGLTVVVARSRRVVGDDGPVAERGQRQAALDRVGVRILLEQRRQPVAALRLARLARSEVDLARAGATALSSAASVAPRVGLLRLQHLFVLRRARSPAAASARSSSPARNETGSRADRRRRSGVTALSSRSSWLRCASMVSPRPR